jgi:hypothetical protein
MGNDDGGAEGTTLRRPLVDRLAAAWPVVALVVFVVSGAILLLAARKQWFFYDEWSYLARDPVGEFSFSQLFISHNGHLIVWTNAWFQLLLQVVGLKHYVLYAIPILLAHVGAAAAGMSVARSLGGSRWLALVGAVSVLLMGAGTRNIMWAGQFSYVLPVTLFLGWLALSLRDHRLVGPRLGWRSALVVSVVGGLSSLVFFPFALTLAGLSATRRRWAEVGAFVVVTGGLAVVGVLTDQFRGSHQDPSRGLLGRVRASLSYMSEGLRAAMADGPGRPVALGVAVLVVTWAGIALVPAAGRRRLTALALAVGPVVFFAVTSLGRADLGSAQALQPRYLYVTLACTVPLWAAELAALSRWIGRRGSRPGALAVLAGAAAGLALLAAWNATFFWSEANAAAVPKTRSHGVVSAAVPLLSDAGVLPAAGVEPRWAPPLDVAQARWYADTGRLRPTASSRYEKAQARVNLFWIVARDQPAPQVGCRTLDDPHSSVRATPDQVLAVFPVSGSVAGVLAPGGFKEREIDRPVTLPKPVTIRAISPQAPGIALTITSGSALVCVRPAQP